MALTVQFNLYGSEKKITKNEIVAASLIQHDNTYSRKYLKAEK